MAVIKIVPMPGAVGDKGDPGETGPQGPQGQTGQTGQNGQDALWNYNGAYNPGAGYAVGDVVTYEGQTWYRKHANGGNVGDTPSQGIFWDLVAAKGTDSIAPTSGSWGHDFFELSSLTTSTVDVLADYYKIGELVYFDLSVNLGYVTDWGTPTVFGDNQPLWPSWRFKLPYNARSMSSQHNNFLTNIVFNGMIWDSSFPEDISERNSNSQGRNAILGIIANEGGQSNVYLYSVEQSEVSTYSTGELKPLTSVHPKDFTEIGNPQPENSIGSSRLRISGTYRSE